MNRQEALERIRDIVSGRSVDWSVLPQEALLELRASEHHSEALAEGGRYGMIVALMEAFDITEQDIATGLHVADLSEAEYEVIRACDAINCDLHGCDDCMHEDSGYQGCKECSSGGHCHWHPKE